MGTSGVGSASGSWLGPSGPTPRASCCAPAMRWSLAVLGALLLQPTTCTKMVFISTLMTLLAPCWAFSWWMRCAAFTACLTLSTLKIGSVAIAFPELEGLDLIYGCCCHNSTIGFVSVEVFHHHLMLLGMLEEGLIHYVLSFLFKSDPFLTSKCFIAWKSNSVLHTAFSASVWYWHLLTRSLICWSNWSVDSCSPCLMLLYISSMWFQ